MQFIRKRKKLKRIVGKFVPIERQMEKMAKITISEHDLQSLENFECIFVFISSFYVGDDEIVMSFFCDFIRL